MTDKLIEEIKRNREERVASGAIRRLGNWIADNASLSGIDAWEAAFSEIEVLQSRILADAEIIKAAEELARLLDEVCDDYWVDRATMAEVKEVDDAVDAFRKAQEARP